MLKKPPPSQIPYFLHRIQSSVCIRVCVLPCSSEAIKAVATLLEHSRTAWLIWNFPSGIQPRTTAATAARKPTTVAWTCSGGKHSSGENHLTGKQTAVDGWHQGRLNTQFVYPEHHDQLDFGSVITDITPQHTQLKVATQNCCYDVSIIGAYQSDLCVETTQLMCLKAMITSGRSYMGLRGCFYPQQLTDGRLNLGNMRLRRLDLNDFLAMN